jgi:hypothetical protein
MPSDAAPAEAGAGTHGGISPGGSHEPAITTAQLFVTGAVPGPIAEPGSRWAARRPAERKSGAPAATQRPSGKGNAAKHGPARQAPAKPRPSATKKAFSCTGSVPSGMLPANYGPIVTYLVGHGYTAIAATGIAGNIYQESKGDPESVGTGGGGLIGWTPLPAGFVTGNVAADLQTQLGALLTYNQQWAQYIPALNAATTPTEAADIYMNYFERPGLPAAYNREGAAQAVAQACGIVG